MIFRVSKRPEQALPGAICFPEYYAHISFSHNDLKIEALQGFYESKKQDFLAMLFDKPLSLGKIHNEKYVNSLLGNDRP